jgi:hypothetical protein
MSYLPASNRVSLRTQSLGYAAKSVAAWLSRHPWLALPFLAVPAVLPLFLNGLPLSHDGPLHVLRLVLLDHHIHQGTFFPRWMPEMFRGLVYPLLNFYGPFVYYLLEFFYLVGQDIASAFMAVYAILLLAAGAGMYLFALSVFGSRRRWAALVAATAYMYAPYLLTNLYVRGAIAELGAQAWLPWVFWSTRRLLTAERPSRYVVAVALSLGGLAVTHNITLLFTPVILGWYALLLWWRTGRSAARLGWMALAIAAAAGISAFFWLPVIIERQYLADTTYQITRAGLLAHSWTGSTFVNLSVVYHLNGQVPFRLGLMQLVFALAGILVAGRRDAEWLYFIVLMVLTGIGISVWSVPVWLGNKTLLIAQFPWRLLTFMTLSMALFAGGILLRLRRDSHQFVGAFALITLIVLTNRPQIGWTEILARPGDCITLHDILRFENEKTTLGGGWTREFWPCWTQGADYAPSITDRPGGRADVRLSQVDAYRLKATVSTPTGEPLRFASLYYPAWRVTLSDGTALPTYPSTDMGLLTVDLPPGSHELLLDWAGTGVQNAATWLSLITLAGLAVFVWRTNRPRWLALLPLGLLTFGLIATLVQPAMINVRLPPRPIVTRSLEMLGYRLVQDGAHGLFIYPYWYIRQTPPADTHVGWQLRDKTGRVLNEARTLPYFNSQKASNWPAATLVDDAYWLPLLPGLPADTYELAVQVAEGNEATAWVPLGTVNFETSLPTQPQPVRALAARFGGLIDLAGVDLRKGGRLVEAWAPRSPVVWPGDSLEYTLYWQPLVALQRNYRGLLHLVDREGRPIAKQDQFAGTLFRPSMRWDIFGLQPDRYLLRIPPDTPSGVYWPMVGLYDLKTAGVDLLPVTDANGQAVGDTYRLPPVKVLGIGPAVRPQHDVAAQLGDLATLVGYDLTLPKAGLRAGSQFSLTLYYRADAVTDQNLTRFAQLYSPELGMAAQQDSPPAHGGNPTWSWVPGEIVTDDVVLTVAPEAQPGSYELSVGLYDAAGGARLPAFDRKGRPLPDAQILMEKLDVVE